MSKIAEIQLEWKYTPSDYLETPIKISELGINLEISKGVAIARIDPEIFGNNSSISADLTKIVENRLYAVQLVTHKKFSLGKPARSDLREDGKKNIFIEVDSIKINLSLGTPDLIITDSDGNIISNTKKERLDKQQWFSETVDRHRTTDVTLDQILKSYQMSVEDPDNELVYLYEVREALARKFGGQATAMEKLCLNKTQWDIIGILANNEPFKQGRHRGNWVGNLRAAELSELEKARKSAALLIEKYLIYLEQNC